MRHNPMLFNQILKSPSPPSEKQTTSINTRLRSSLQSKPISTQLYRNQKLNDTLATEDSTLFK